MKSGLKQEAEIEEKQTDAGGGRSAGSVGLLAETGSVAVGRPGQIVHCISIIGQVEGHYILPDNQKSTKYEHLLPLLAAIEESPDVQGVLVLLNTMGGDVEAGLCLAEMIGSMSKPTVSLVLGGGHSIGIPLAVAARKSLIVPSATMTLHPVRISGVVIGAPQTYTYLSEMQERIVDFICGHSRAKREEIRDLMLSKDNMANDVGTILGAHEAVEAGIMDGVGGLSDALLLLHGMIQK